MARYWSSPNRRVDKRMTADTMVATKVSTKQKEASSITEDAVRSSRLRGVSRRRENRLERTRLRTNLKTEKIEILLFFSFFSFYLLLRVLKPLLLKKRMTRTVLRMMPMRKVMQMMTSKSTRIKRSLSKPS